MSDITKEPMEQVKQAFKDRISSPLWGYVFFSWLGFNWQNIARLFMSKKPVEERIVDITSQSWFIPHYIILPVVMGAILAALSPYLQEWLAAAHKRAEDKKNEKILAEELRLIDVDMLKKEKLTKLSKVAEHTEQSEKEKLERQNARNESRIALIKLRETALTKSTQNIEKLYTESQIKLNSVLDEIKQAEEKYKIKIEAINNAAEALNKIAELYYKYDNLNTHEDFVKFIKEIKSKNLFGSAFLDNRFNSMVEREVIFGALNGKGQDITKN